MNTIKPLKFNKLHKYKMVNMLNELFPEYDCYVKKVYVELHKSTDKPIKINWLGFTLRILPQRVFDLIEDPEALIRFKTSIMTEISGKDSKHPIDFLYSQCESSLKLPQSPSF